MITITSSLLLNTEDSTSKEAGKVFRHFLIILALTVVISSIAYHVFRGDRITFHQAERLYDDGHWAKAAELYTALEANGFRGGSLLQHLAVCHEAMLDYNRALLVYERLRAAAPKDHLLAKKVASLHEILGQFDRAVAIYREILVLHPEQSQTRIRLARVLKKKKKKVESVNEYRKALGDEK